MIARVLLIGWKQISVTAQDETKRFSSSRPGARATDDDCEKLLEIAELAAAFRGTSEFALETSQQAAACLATLRRVWPDPLLETLSAIALRNSEFRRSLSVVLGVRAARQDIPATLALPAFLQSYLANLVTAGVRLVPLGQTDGQLALPSLSQQCWPWLHKLNRQRLTIWGRPRSWSILLPHRMKPNTRGCFAHD